MGQNHKYTDKHTDTKTAVFVELLLQLKIFSYDRKLIVETRYFLYLKEVLAVHLYLFMLSAAEFFILEQG